MDTQGAVDGGTDADMDVDVDDESVEVGASEDVGVASFELVDVVDGIALEDVSEDEEDTGMLDGEDTTVLEDGEDTGVEVEEDKLVLENEDDNATLLHFPNPAWQPVPQYLRENY